MSRGSRALSVLRLFEPENRAWTVEEIAASLGVSVSTAYRRVRELVETGFLDPVSGTGYMLGPAFIRYDRLLRQSDPLLRVAAPILADLLARTTPEATAILCRRFKDCVMCVDQAQGTKGHSRTSYERGVAMPLFLGATSKVVLAHLPGRVLRRVYLENEEVIRRASRRTTWTSFRAELAAIRRQGFALTAGEVSGRRIGIAAPVLRGGRVDGSVSLVLLREAHPDPAEAARFAPEVVRAARLISERAARTPASSG